MKWYSNLRHESLSLLSLSASISNMISQGYRYGQSTTKMLSFPIQIFIGTAVKYYGKERAEDKFASLLPHYEYYNLQPLFIKNLNMLLYAKKKYILFWLDANLPSSK